MARDHHTSVAAASFPASLSSHLLPPKLVAVVRYSVDICNHHAYWCVMEWGHPTRPRHHNDALSPILVWLVASGHDHVGDYSLGDGPILEAQGICVHLRRRFSLLLCDNHLLHLRRSRLR